MSGGFQFAGFQSPGFQVGVTVTVPPLEPQDVLARMFRFRPPELKIGVHANIRSTLPALTQSATATVRDDELVLLLI